MQRIFYGGFENYKVDNSNYKIILNSHFERKKLVLFEDEKMILDQLCEGKVYQKEVEGFSENTIYRKLKAARERNGNISRDELVEKYRKEKEYKSSF